MVSQKTLTYNDTAGERHSFIIKIFEKWDSEKQIWFIDFVNIVYPGGILLPQVITQF